MEKYTSELFEFMMKEKEGERLDVHIHDIYKLEDVRKAHEVSFVVLYSCSGRSERCN